MIIQRADTGHIPGLIRLLYQVGGVHHDIRPDLFRSGAIKYTETDLEALLEQERLGALTIRRYHELTEGMLNWIRKAEADSIKKYDLINTPGPMADYYKEHYPESWELAKELAGSIICFVLRLD